METTAAQGGGTFIFYIFLLAFVVMMLWSGRGQKKRDQERLAKVWKPCKKGIKSLFPAALSAP